MKPSLNLRLSTQLTLTPQLQQAIRLLQLSTLELNQELETILAENPMLERLDDPLLMADRIAPDGVIDRATAAGPADEPRDWRNGQDEGSAPGEGQDPASAHSAEGGAAIPGGRDPTAMTPNANCPRLPMRRAACRITCCSSCGPPGSAPATEPWSRS